MKNRLIVKKAKQNVNIIIFSNLHFVKDFLKMDQRGESIHKIDKLATLNPALMISIWFSLKSVIVPPRAKKPTEWRGRL